MKLSKWIGAFAFVFLPSAFAAPFDCKVVALSDGDTFTCVDAAKQQFKIRLANIDTPEKSQPYGAKAKLVLSSLIFNRQVLIDSQGVDRYGRTIGIISIDGLNVNREMIARGAAWVYPQYNRDSLLPAIESAARAANLGIWGQGQAQVIPPWEWRKLGKQLNAEFTARKNQAAASPIPLPLVSGSCGKRICGQMTNCADAKFHLEQCGVSSLDRDGDGVPCESLCK